MPYNVEAMTTAVLYVAFNSCPGNSLRGAGVKGGTT